MTCPCGEQIQGANKHRRHGVWRHKACPRTVTAKSVQQKKQQLYRHQVELFEQLKETKKTAPVTRMLHFLITHYKGRYERYVNSHTHRR